MTPYQALFLTTLVPGVLIALRRGGDSFICAIVVILSFVSTRVSWPSNDPVFTNAAFDLSCAIAIAGLCEAKKAMVLGFMFALAGVISIIFGISNQSQDVYSYEYATGLSIVGHMQNIWLAWWGRGLDTWHNRRWKMGRGFLLPGFRHWYYHRENDEA